MKVPSELVSKSDVFKDSFINFELIKELIETVTEVLGHCLDYFWTLGHERHLEVLLIQLSIIIENGSY